MAAWAEQNYSDQERNTFNNLLQSGNAAKVDFAVSSLYNRYRNEVGYEGELVSGSAGPNDVYKNPREFLDELPNGQSSVVDVFDSIDLSKLERTIKAKPDFLNFNFQQ